MIKKLDAHQDKLEKVFKVYYDTLDEARKEILG